MPAEWENPKAILLTYPGVHTDWAPILTEARGQFRDLISALIDAREFVWLITDRDIETHLREKIESNEGIIFEEIPFNDTWTRDYGPITVLDEEKRILHLDFGFNGWGLKFPADHDNLVNLRMAQSGIIPELYECYENHLDFELEGGSVETDGKGTILTTSRCLCSPNRNGGKGKKEIEEILKEKLGAHRVLWLDHGFLEGDDTDSHIDTLARMAPEDTILYVAPPQNDTDIHYEELVKMEQQLHQFLTPSGQYYRLIPLPFPNPIYDEEGNRLPATYANYLVTGWNLFLPTYAQPSKDSEAVHAVQMAFPEHKIYTVDCRTLIKQHGSLHCSTMQLYI